MAKTELHDGNDAGVSLGASATQLVGFFGAAPVVQQTVVTDATSTTTTTSTTGALTTDLDDLRTQFNELNAKLKTLGLIASA